MGVYYDANNVALGMRVIIRDEERIIQKNVKNDLDDDVLYCTGISTLVKDRFPAL